jgi:hypothetical protein
MKDSGIGRENGVEALNACKRPSLNCIPDTQNAFAIIDSQSKSTIVNIASVEESLDADDWFSAAGATRYG